MALRFSTGLRDDILGTSDLKTTMTDGVIRIYTGVQPASADNAPTGTQLGLVTVDAGAFTPGSPTNGLEFGTPSGGVIAKAVAETWKMVATAAGTAGWFRFVGNAVDNDSESTTLPRIDGSIARTGGDLNLSVVVFEVSTPVTIDVFQLTMNEA